MHCTKNLTRVRIGGQRSRSPGTKKEKTTESPLTMPSKVCAIRRKQQQTIPQRRSRGGGNRVRAVYADDGLRKRSSEVFYAGGKISACCLVTKLGSHCVLQVNGCSSHRAYYYTRTSALSHCHHCHFSSSSSIRKILYFLNNII